MAGITIKRGGPRRRKMLKERTGIFTIPSVMIAASYELAWFATVLRS
jgi:hypothetical protein